MSDTTKMIVATNKLMLTTKATLKVISATSKMILATEKRHNHFKMYRSNYKNDLGH